MLAIMHTEPSRRENIEASSCIIRLALSLSVLCRSRPLIRVVVHLHPNWMLQFLQQPYAVCISDCTSKEAVDRPPDQCQTLNWHHPQSRTDRMSLANTKLIGRSILFLRVLNSRSQSNDQTKLQICGLIQKSVTCACCLDSRIWIPPQSSLISSTIIHPLQSIFNHQSTFIFHFINSITLINQ